MIALVENMSSQRTKELHQAGARRRLAMRIRRAGARPTAPARGYGRRLADYEARLTIRRLDSAGGDREAIERVAGRDSAPVLTGDLLGAELDGRLVAVVSLDDGRSIADPFSPSAEATVLLRRRAERIRGTNATGGHRLRLRTLRRAGHSRP